mgnify:CR=1 FL=1|jgi:uncharacterized membrane protein
MVCKSTESVHCPGMSGIDLVAFSVFILLWLGYVWLADGRQKFARMSLNGLMAEYRARWIRNSLKRDLKMIDTQIMGGLQNGTGFFASASIIALGGCLSVFGTINNLDLPGREGLSIFFAGGRAIAEMKLAGLALIFGYAFFKFGWAYRMFNYCSILFGALPMVEEAEKDPVSANRAADRVIALNIIAAENFNGGLRAIFLSIGYLGWFVNPYVFMAASAFVIVVLVRRQFFSPARRALEADLQATP